MTTLTTLKGIVAGDFPILTDYGIVENRDLGLYLNAMSECNYTFTENKLTAVTAFFETGKKYGWLDKLLYVLPFIGNSETFKAAAIPMVDRFSKNKPLVIGASSIGLNFNEEYYRYFSVDGNNNVLSAKPYRTDLCLVLNLSVYDLFTKTDKNTNANNGNYGINWYGQCANSGSLFRITQASGFETNNYLGFTANGSFAQELFSMIVSSSALGNSFFSGTSKYFGESYKTTGQNIMQYRTRNNNLDNIVFSNETADRDDYNTLSNVDLAKKCLFGLNASWNNITNSVGRTSLTAGLETRFLAFHDGTIDVSDEVTYIPALKTLLSAFNKLF